MSFRKKSGASRHGICARCYANNSERESMNEQEAFVDMARSADLGARVNALEMDERRAAADGYISSLRF
jgi:hypothetical protein